MEGDECHHHHSLLCVAGGRDEGWGTGPFLFHSSTLEPGVGGGGGGGWGAESERQWKQQCRTLDASCCCFFDFELMVWGLWMKSLARATSLFWTCGGLTHVHALQWGFCSLLNDSGGLETFRFPRRLFTSRPQILNLLVCERVVSTVLLTLRCIIISHESNF